MKFCVATFEKEDGGDFFDFKIISIFSTKKLANEAIKKRRKENHTDNGDFIISIKEF